MRPFGTFSKHITCQYYLMTWHILYFVYCIGNGAWAVSRCQEASSFGSSLSWARGLNWGGAKKKQPRGAAGSSHSESRGVPAAACRWRAGLSHLLSPRKLHSYEREGENVQFYTSLPRPVSSTKTIFLPSSYLRK